MTQQTSVTADLRRLVAEGYVSIDSLHAMTQVETHKLNALLFGPPAIAGRPAPGDETLSPEENARIAVLAAQLAHGLDIDDDERLRGILESLTTQCSLTLDNVARLTGQTTKDVEVAVADPASLPAGTKYILALRGSYLINAANMARSGQRN